MNSIKDAKFIITFFFVVPAWYTIWQFPESNPHMILATNVLSALAGYWYGSSLGSSDKNQILGGLKHEAKPEVPGPIPGPAVPDGVRRAVRADEPTANG